MLYQTILYQAAAASGGQPSLPSRPHHGQLEALQPLQPEIGGEPIV